MKKKELVEQIGIQCLLNGIEVPENIETYKKLQLEQFCIDNEITVDFSYVPPNSKFKTLKCCLKTILTNDNENLKNIYLQDIQKAVKEVNIMTFTVYNLIKSYILEYETNEPLNNDNFIYCCFMVVSNTSLRKDKLNDPKYMEIYNRIKKVYDRDYLPFIPRYFVVSNRSKYKQTIINEITKIKTHLTNNCEHYYTHLGNFMYEWCKKEQNKVKKHTIQNDIRNTLKTKKVNLKEGKTRPQFYRLLFQKIFDLGYFYVGETIDLTHMLKLSIFFEASKIKTFNFIPIKRTLQEGHITMDTNSLIELFKDYPQNIELTESLKKQIWSRYFNMEHKYFFFRKDYLFRHTITTNGYEVCILFNHKDNTGSYNPPRKKDKSVQEFLYLDQLKLYYPEKYKEHENGENLVLYADPGKQDILTIMDDNQNFFYYRKRNYVKEMKFKEKNEYIRKIRDKYDLIQMETEKSQFNSKTTDPFRFRQYIRFVFEQYIPTALKVYTDKLFKKLKLQQYVNRQKHYSNLINRIKQTFNITDQKVDIIYGDWDIKRHLKNMIPTPMIGLKRILQREFNIYDIEERNTSKICYYSEEEVKNPIRTDKIQFRLKTDNEKSTVSVKINPIKINQVVVSNIPTTGLKRFQNRNRNACLNFKKLHDLFVSGQRRPLNYVV